MDSNIIWNALLTVAMAIISGLVALGAKYISQIQASVAERIDNINKEIKQLRDDYREDYCSLSFKMDAEKAELNNFKVGVNRDFVSREEHIRATQTLDAKMDRVLKEIGCINVNIARIAAANANNKEANKQ